MLKGVSTIAIPASFHIFWTNDHMLHYRYLCHQILTNVKFSNIYLHRNNKCAQVFVSEFGLVHVHPMKTKARTHEASSLMFQLRCNTTMNGSKEQTLGKFFLKLIDAYCQIKQTESHSPWQNVNKWEKKEKAPDVRACYGNTSCTVIKVF